MKKMTKGAIVTGLGVALLLGGGGTLAVWNQTATADAGQIAAGDLNLTADAGVWTDHRTGEQVDITSYKVIPGSSLTYTQDLDVTLEGTNLSATLVTTGGSVNNGFTPENVVVGPVTLTNSNGHNVPATGIHQSETFTAETTFEFLESTTGRDSVNAHYDFSQIGYKLEQVAPVASAAE